ncbi:MAG: RnfH family protein [Gammaproteobacteria bacterium]|nr:RnfH family protein [Gammaproteobacteria bacterium]
MTELSVEVVYAVAGKQLLVAVSLPSGATVADAIDASGIQESFAGDHLEEMAVGVWGHVVSRDQPVADGDRVEIYRPLAIDPREARRQRAALGKTMRKSGEF